MAGEKQSSAKRISVPCFMVAGCHGLFGSRPVTFWIKLGDRQVVEVGQELTDRLQEQMCTPSHCIGRNRLEIWFCSQN